MLTQIEATEQALDFLMNEWNLSNEERKWFIIFNSRSSSNSWYIVEIGVEGYPDRWFIQVYDTGDCDPNYTFHSPLAGALAGTADLSRLPDKIAEAIASERSS